MPTAEFIFMIGPGGVGKTTVGRLLAPLLGYRFVDLDEAFCDGVAPIRTFLDQQGYSAYVRRNSKLLHTLLQKHVAPSGCVFALSSGFLVTDVEPQIVEANRRTVRATGKSILLLPSEDLVTALKIVVERQLNRGLKLERASQERIFRERFHDYRQMGDLQIFSTASPQEIAQHLAMHLLAI